MKQNKVSDSVYQVPRFVLLHIRHVLIWGGVLFSINCTYREESIVQTFSRPEYQPEEPGGWGANRRFLFLAQVFSRKGFKRCDPYYTDKGCPGKVSLYAERISRKSGKKIEYYNSKLYTDKNLVLKNSGNEKPLVILVLPYFPISNTGNGYLFILDTLKQDIPHYVKNCAKPWKIILTGSLPAHNYALNSLVPERSLKKKPEFALLTYSHDNQYKMNRVNLQSIFTRFSETCK